MHHLTQNAARGPLLNHRLRRQLNRRQHFQLVWHTKRLAVLGARRTGETTLVHLEESVEIAPLMAQLETSSLDQAPSSIRLPLRESIGNWIE
jgi:hypothetical protein